MVHDTRRPSPLRVAVIADGLGVSPPSPPCQPDHQARTWRMRRQDLAARKLCAEGPWNEPQGAGNRQVQFPYSKQCPGKKGDNR